MKSAMMNGYKVNLVQSLEDLQYAKDYIKKVVGIDTETSGLNYITDTIAGYCFAGGSPIQGFYYPVRHLIGKNLPIEPIVEYMQYCLDNKKCMLFNKSFDFSMMEKDCINIPLRGDHHDVQVMVWEATNEKFPGLKPSCKAYLKFEMIEFSDVAGSVGYNFRETDPELSFMYAAFDPVATVLLGRKFWNDFPYIRKIYPVDNLCTEVARRMGKIDIKLDYDILRKSLEQEEKVLRELRNKAHQLAGYEFNVGSNRDKAEALNRFVNLTQKTKTGQFCVKDEVLQNIDHPLAQTILAYSKQVKYISSFIKALLAIEGKPFYSNMKLTAVPCLTKHNFVVLRHRGLVSISEVATGDEILTRFGWKRVLHSESKWSDFVVAFSTKSDIGLEGTGHHPVLVKTEDGEKWKDIQCLEKGEKAVTLKSYPCGGLEIVANQIKDKLSSNLLSFDDAAFVHVALKYICVWSKLKATESNCYLFITNEGIERLRRWGITRLSSNVLIEEHEDSYDIDWVSLKEPDEDDDQYGDYVYDIEVEDVHEYVANGIVTHNTGRFATGKVKGNPYYAEVNIMGIKKEKMKRYLHYDESLPCKYFLDDNPEGAIGKQEVKAGTRDAFIAPEGYYFYTSDYKSEELALGGNLCMSGETEVTLKSGKAKLKDIVRGDVVLTPLGYRIVEERFDVGEKEAWRVTLEDGRQFECSPYHVFLVMSSSVLQFKELQYIDLEIDELLTENDEVNERDFKTALHNFRSTSE